MMMAFHPHVCHVDDTADLDRKHKASYTLGRIGINGIPGIHSKNLLFQIKLQTLLAQLVSRTRRNMAPLVPDKRAALLSEIQSLVEEATPEASARLFNAAQVALLFGVSERTVRVWANKNWIPAIRTPSGHWKFPAMQIAQVYKTGLQQGKFPPRNSQNG